ncbi:hypothetical protein OBBRIDRAFT_763141 [Obba rivulosa]|uniref:Protein kinase domain-containing protein n=1 Tax=Obba rivulosa TaxID=1052685 RepID=A0A8E2AIR5_9APHY|nr:hypothetical protein OBBRIDRAFT_763141 [Obba rivulosa]
MDVDDVPRDRKITYEWVRDPNGKVLPSPGPPGYRTPEGYVWGHSLESFFRISLLPGINYMRVYSRSMLKELGENYSDEDFDYPEPHPRVRKPWPVLSDRRSFRPPLSDEDEGSDHDDEGDKMLRQTRRRKLLETLLLMESMKIKHDNVPELKLTQFVVDNNTSDPVICPYKTPYIKLWAPEFQPFVKSLFAKHMFQPLDFVGSFGVKLRKVIDETGVMAVSVDGEKGFEDGHVRSILRFVDPEKVKAATTKATNADAIPDVCVYIASQASDVHNSSIATVPGSVRVVPVTPVVETRMDTSTCSDNVPDRVQPRNIPEESPPIANEELKIESMEIDSEDRKDGASDEDTSEDMSRSGSKESAHLASTSPFYVDDMPKLEEFIPEEFIPDILVVYDSTPLAHKYKRILPAISRDSISQEHTRVAHLHTHPANAIGKGHHSYVRRGALTLPEPLYGCSRTGQVTVAVKTAELRGHARRLLRNEADMYARFPQHLQQEYCGYHLVRPIWHPVPVGPVVPKFYGYYVPLDDHGNAIDELYKSFHEDEDGPVSGPSPILLIEECGKPVNPSTFSLDERSECYSLLCRLHNANFIQNSFYTRNILVQPGPLTRPPAERSRRTPSFRIIDFGRGEFQDDVELERLPASKRNSTERQFAEKIRSEDQDAHKALKLDMCDY